MVVTRKYLCPAPHPSTWDERAEALLKSLGGSQKRRERILRQTLTVLKATRPPEKKKTGPGRKSNAEHAINFYNHVLELNAEETGDESQESNDDRKPSPRPAKRRRKQQQDEDDDDSSSSSSSRDTQEFLDQHNDLCEVCNGSGELLCCNTCNLVFHMKCSKPSLQKMPPDTWSCSYCVASGTTGHKRNTHIRKRAQAACREMDRMRDESQGKRRGPQKDDKDTEPSGEIPAAVESTIVQVVEEGERPSEEPETKEDSSSESAKRTDVDKKDDTTAPSQKSEADEDDNNLQLEDANKRRARRERKSTTLYDPQLCAASAWQSDGMAEWMYLAEDGKGRPSDDTEEDNEEGSNTESGVKEKASTASSDGPVWCSFCKDDPSIPICCFCACRVCFGKHQAQKLLLCDNCDQEYHTFCLDPPLASVPVARKWFCPSCKASKKAASPAAKAKQRSAKRSPGRPKSTSPSHSKSSASPKKRARGSNGRFSFKSPADSDSPKKRGRPRKNQSPSPTKRRRGRPPKNSKSPPTTPKRSGASKQAKPAKLSAAKRKEASKTSKETVSSASRKGTARTNALSLQSTSTASSLGPQKVVKNVHTGLHPILGVAVGTYPAVGAMTSASAPNGVAPDTPGTSTTLSSGGEAQRSRSGRIMKRSSFHDDIYVGEQHLRVVKRKVPSVEYNQDQQVSAANGQVPESAALVAPSPVPHTLSTVPSAAGSQPSLSGKQPLLSATIQQSTGTSSATKIVPSVSANASTVTSSSGTPAASVPNSGVTPGLATAAAVSNTGAATNVEAPPAKVPRRKPGARECMQISRRFGVNMIPQKYMDTLLDYCTRGKVEHLIRMRERLDEHSSMLEAQIAALEIAVKEKGELDITVPSAVPEGDLRPPGPTRM